MIAGLPAQPRRAQFVEPAAADLKLQTGAGGVQLTGIEGAENVADVRFGQAFADLFFFMSPNPDAEPGGANAFFAAGT
jgi:hypothetical protein